MKKNESEGLFDLEQLSIADLIKMAVEKIHFASGVPSPELHFLTDLDNMQTYRTHLENTILSNDIQLVISELLILRHGKICISACESLKHHFIYFHDPQFPEIILYKIRFKKEYLSKQKSSA